MTQIGRKAGSIWQPAPLTNWVNIPVVLVAGATATQNSPFSSLAVVVTIASTHCAYHGGMAWAAGYVVRQSPIPILTGLNVEQLRWSRPTCYRYTKPPPFFASFGDRPKLSMSFLSQIFGRPLCLIPSTSHDIQQVDPVMGSYFHYHHQSAFTIYNTKPVRNASLHCLIQSHQLWQDNEPWWKNSIIYVVHLLVSPITMGEPINDNGLKAKWVMISV